MWNREEESDADQQLPDGGEMDLDLSEQIKIIDKNPMKLNLVDLVNDAKEYNAILYVYDP